MRNHANENITGLVVPRVQRERDGDTRHTITRPDPMGMKRVC